MAIRQAVAAGTRITYKLLVNDAVAMTGGQPAEGNFSVAQYAAQVAAEGVARIAVVADEADRLPPASAAAGRRDARMCAPSSTRCSASCATMTAYPC